MLTIDLSLNNAALYDGCAVETVAGRSNLTTPVAAAIEIVGANVARLVAETTDRDAVTLTGPMAVWAYLVVFHAVVHAFREVCYHDGRGEPVVIARHG
jgi:hypothetical protein